MISLLTRKNNPIYYILFLNFLLRLLVVMLTDLGIDEAYYVSYPLYPDWSYFDHPPMIAWLIQLTTLNLNFMHEFFIRLGPLLIGTANIYMIYKIGIQLKDQTSGIVAALLLSSSFYGSIIAGAFILPDTPQSIFWLLSIYLFLKYLSFKKGYYLLLFGITAGLAMLSKYHGVFLWAGAGLYFLLYDRKVLISKSLLLSVLISLILFSPVILWNYLNHLSSFNYHAGRVGNQSYLPSFDNFFVEFFGEIFYNNPFNVGLILMSLTFLWKTRKIALTTAVKFILCASVPLVLLVLLMSLFNSTLPHWTGPAYFGFILIAGYTYSYRLSEGKSKLFDRIILYGNAFFILIVLVGLVHINIGLFPVSPHLPENKTGSNDPSLDMVGWRQVSRKLDSLIRHDLENNSIKNDPVILTHKWFPAAHLDYYYAMPNHMRLYVPGNTESTHNYSRLNLLRGDILHGTDAYYISTSHYFKPPDKKILACFERVDEPEIIPIYRHQMIISNIFVWRMTNLVQPLPLNWENKVPE